MIRTLLIRPSAWIPVALSLLVIVAWVIGIAVSGFPQPEPDEGTAAHLFQLWLAIEVVLIVAFAMIWLPRDFKWAIPVLALQIAAVLIGCAPVYILGL